MNRLTNGRRKMAITRRAFMGAAGATAASLALPGMLVATVRHRPNILWIMIEDWSLDLSCYGAKGIATPHLDGLAAEGVRYGNAFTTAPVCSASRSAMITGFHQNYIGCHQHRTDHKEPLPYGIKPVPHLLAEAGYYTVLMDGKTDCNFTTEKPLFMGRKRDWKARKPGQPFFAQLTLHGTHRKWNRDPERPIDIDDVEIPPYYPDSEFVRRDWANGLEQAQIVDRQVGKVLARLKREGLADDTIVFLIGDHGRCHIRGKQFLYDPGLRVPMMMRWPGKIKPGQVSDDLVQSIDISATVLDVADVDPGYDLHGRSLLGEGTRKRKYVFAARDKMDSTHDAMRMVRSKRYKLIHNLMPERAYCQFNAYKERSYPVLALMNVMAMQGKLNPAQAAFMASSKSEFELYDVENDPHEVRNRAQEPGHAKIKAELLAELNRWREDVKDTGVSDEFRKGGWPAKYPTRTLKEWKGILKRWKPWVFRKPGKKMKRPKVKTPEFAT